MKVEVEDEIYDDQPPTLPLIRLRTSGQDKNDELAERPTNQETNINASMTASQLRKMEPYGHDTRHLYNVFSRELDDKAIIGEFLSRYQPYNKKLIQEHKEKFTLLRMELDRMYVGEVYNGKGHGTGIIVFSNGKIYEGTLENNLRQGQGFLVNPDRTWYYGEFLNDKKDGIGMEVGQRATYHGGFVNGLKHGNGILVSKNMSYSGQWRLGIINGYGVLETADSKYQGHFNNFLKHGQGRQIFNNGDEYVGRYSNGKPQGQGQYVWKESGCTFKGSFRHGQRNGKGLWTNSEGDKYVGGYVEDLKSGYGQFYWRSGNFYKGNFLQDKRQGYGQMFWSDGCVYKGQWHKGVQHGKGELYIVGQETYIGIFENNMLVNLLQSPEKVKNRSMMHLTERKDDWAATRENSQKRVGSYRDFQETGYRKLPVNPIKKSKNTSKQKSALSKSPHHSPNSSHHRFCKACAQRESTYNIKSTKKVLSRTYHLKRNQRKNSAAVNHFMMNHPSQY